MDEQAKGRMTAQAERVNRAFQDVALKRYGRSIRDPERIDAILSEIRRIWNDHPDWRLGQLLSNVTGLYGSLRTLEDDTLLSQLYRYPPVVKLEDTRGPNPRSDDTE